MALHSAEQPGSIHVVHNFTYADAAARTAAAGLTAADIGKVARQLDDDSFWLLSDTTPTWLPFSATVNDHGSLSGLGDDDHPQYQLRAEKGAAGGYAELDGGGTIPDAQIPASITRDAEATALVAAAIGAHEAAGDPHPGYQLESEKGVANGYAGLDAGTKLLLANLPDVVPQAEAEAGTATTVRSWTAQRVAQAIAALGGGGTSNVVLEEHFFSSTDSVQGDIGQNGWRRNNNGTANALTIVGVAGHPGVLDLFPGTSVNGRIAVYLGDTNTSNIVLSNTGLQNTLTVEFLMRMTGSVSAVDLELIHLGLLTVGDMGNNGEATGNGVYVRFNPTTSPNFALVARNPAASVVTSGTAVAVNTWYRVGFVVTDAGGGSASVQLQINGANVGAPITTNIPIGTQLVPAVKIDGQGSGNAVALQVDRVRVIQAVTP